MLVDEVGYLLLRGSDVGVCASHNVVQRQISLLGGGEVPAFRFAPVELRVDEDVDDVQYLRRQVLWSLRWNRLFRKVFEHCLIHLSELVLRGVLVEPVVGLLFGHGLPDSEEINEIRVAVLTNFS